MGAGASFLRPVGPAADVKELEYIAALHQATEPREDGSIIDEDIAIFLKSRYGIVVSVEEVRNSILQGLQADAGLKKGDDNNAVLDIMELTATLFIPLLKKSAQLIAGDHKLPDGVAEPPPGLIPTVLQTVLQDVCGQGADSAHKQPKLTTDLLRRLFQAYGEDDIANNSQLLQKMIDSCKEGDDDEERGFSVRLDARAFAKGLTHDVEQLDIANEGKMTTNKDDVFLSYVVPKGRNSETVLGIDLDATAVHKKLEDASDVETVFTFPSIDVAASTYKSKSLMVFLYATVLIMFFVFSYEVRTKVKRNVCSDDVRGYAYSESPWTENGEALGCSISSNIVQWLAFFLFSSVFGVVFVICASVGNSEYNRDWRGPMLGMLTAVLLFVFTILLTTIDDSSTDDIADNDVPADRRFLRFASWTLSMVVFIHHLINLLSLKNIQWRQSWLRSVMNPSALRSEYNMKKAGAHKMNNLAKNAMDLLHQDSNKGAILTSNFAQALTAFAKDGFRLEPAGGIIWTWKGARNKVLYREEGIWYSARVLASNICQYVVSLFVVAGGVTFFMYVDENFEASNVKSFTSQVIDFVVESKFDNETGLLISTTGSTDAALNVTPELLQEATDIAVDYLYPKEQYMISFPLVVGFVIAFVVAINLSLSFIPSVTSTILKLRCGVIPLNGNPLLIKYREAPEKVALLIGALFWGTLGSAILTGGVWGLVIFLFLWQGSATFAQRFLAVAIGIILITLIQFFGFTFCRTQYFKGFYRRRPAVANLVTLALEWSSFVLSSGFIFVRMVKLMFIAGISVGRIDKPLFAPNIGKIGPLDLDDLDDYPIIFLRDVLIHEAHRHPYIELLGTMYLYKIRYKASFGSTVGACWRLLFVYGLMPWLHQYRIQTKSRISTTVDPENSASLLDFGQRGFDGEAEYRSLIEESEIASGWSLIRESSSLTYSMDNIFLQQIRKLQEENAELKQVLTVREQPVLTVSEQPVERKQESDPGRGDDPSGIKTTDQIYLQQIQLLEQEIAKLKENARLHEDLAELGERKHVTIVPHFRVAL